MSERWLQERPTWCPHTDCVFKRRAQDAICGGHLPAPIDHDRTPNTDRICLNGAAENGGVLDLRVNATDLGYFRWIFDALDGKRTSWLSRRAKRPRCPSQHPERPYQCVKRDGHGGAHKCHRPGYSTLVWAHP